MDNRISVHMDGAFVYDIVMETSFEELKENLEQLGTKERKACIVTDSNVSSLYLKEVEGVVGPCFQSVEHFVFPAGEKQKNLDTVRELYQTLIAKQFNRHDYLLALGGGVVGDLCGYAAATYLRGISFVQIPTTLLSQVDSSIGGKTGVDFDAYKNMVGAFHMPKLVYTNISALNTLNEEQFSSGMGEIIKHGLIKDKAYYQWLVDHNAQIRNREVPVLKEMVRVSNIIKRDIVEEDPLEQADRALLNFGHTLGHAIEKLSDFRLLHGHCVGLGCIAAMAVSVNRKKLKQEELSKLIESMKQFGLPVTVSGLSSKDVIYTTKNDKKMDAKAVRFVLLEEIGKAYVDKSVTEKEMAAGLEYVLAREEV